ncbi:glycosyltransferase [Mesorhizobium sp. WSM4976]|uniref:glycosyltransferase family 2 protein n=1 Tax=Mesorhizobium sp. WSM4976 TaxID=3038549 RepID=UPI002418135B|nr:glycosyltransferase [Mesorhizobium sp. WSM4976]MDG4896871.1 glycosyltransferase [Mesorhizobium sp. WSM4976]
MDREQRKVVICILALGKPAYSLAAREALTSFLRHSDFEIYVTTDPDSAALLPRSPRLQLNLVGTTSPSSRASGFLAKFEALTWCLERSGAEIVLQVDADAVLVRPLAAHDVADALGDGGMAMVEQTGIAGSAMGRHDFLAHYRNYTLAFVDGSLAAPREEDFRYFNSGVVIARASELRRFLDWTTACLRRLPPDHAIGGQMVADQDYFQIWTNTLAPERRRELPWQWNHCRHWDDGFPQQGALIAHFSNFCNGPDTEAVMAMHALVNAAQVPAVPEADKPAALAFIVITHNSSKVIGYCLDKLADLSANLPIEIIVVDNGSTDDTLERITRPGVTILRNMRNEGFAAAANRGAMAARADHLCFLNPDCVMTLAAAEAALALVEAKPEAIAVPDYIDWQGERTAGKQPGYSRIKLIADILRSHGKVRLAERLKRLPGYDCASWNWPLAAALFIGRGCFERLGGFNERYFCYMEDVAIGFEIAKRGLDIVQLDQVLPHFGQHGADVVPALRAQMLGDARIQFARLHYGRTFALALTALRSILHGRWAVKDVLRRGHRAVTSTPARG